jgi:hypothetical protein
MDPGGGEAAFFLTGQPLVQGAPVPEGKRLEGTQDLCGPFHEWCNESSAAVGQRFIGSTDPLQQSELQSLDSRNPSRFQQYLQRVR